jgi:hypothetical protein
MRSIAQTNDDKGIVEWELVGDFWSGRSLKPMMTRVSGNLFTHSVFRGMMWPISETNIDKGIVEFDGFPDFTDEIRACG